MPSSPSQVARWMPGLPSMVQEKHDLQRGPWHLNPWG